MRKITTVLLGRKTYDTFAAAWPGRETAGGDDAPMAKALGDARKIVVSNQELTFTWRNSEQLAGDLVEAVTAMRSEPGDSNVGMSGSVSVVRQMLAAGLVDELNLLVHPIALGSGMRLFDEGETATPSWPCAGAGSRRPRWNCSIDLVPSTRTACSRSGSPG